MTAPEPPGAPVPPPGGEGDLPSAVEPGRRGVDAHDAVEREPGSAEVRGRNGVDRRAAHRAALDHVLALVADAPWSGTLVLRGSMVVQAWLGDAAREPADLDWVVLENAVGIDPLDPYPYIDGADTVQQWPEAADGAARYEMWTYEEFETGGQRPVLPPEGLHWLHEQEAADAGPPYLDLLDRVERCPEAAPGLLLAANRARVDGTWTYTEYDTPGVRLIVPWHTEGLPPGEVRLDFARDEVLPESPVWTLVPRGDGGRPTAVRTASRELSLAWKVLWLYSDSRDGRTARGKDLYDAVLLAEAEGAWLSPRLLRRVFGRAWDTEADGFDPATVARWKVDWAEFQEGHPWVTGSGEDWLHRLGRALGTIFTEQRPAPTTGRTGGTAQVRGAQRRCRDRRRSRGRGVCDD
ncbi:nucleotidyl transferase AbiEii/AbiGii toxin family protein [Streptomyces sp. NPDC003631]|uniref:nucleotidyl transferase AbiEii/AbiGii toxin family protein n=1 Tax=unclassified Streptomyces TaxID=2593676 RepID=UPI0036A43026